MVASLVFDAENEGHATVGCVGADVGIEDGCVGKDVGYTDGCVGTTVGADEGDSDSNSNGPQVLRVIVY